MALDLMTIAQMVLPWLPAELVAVYVANWTEYGDPELALSATRDDPVYEQHFPGIMRDNGTMRTDELSYMATITAYEDALVGVGVNPQVLGNRFGELIAGEVSADEFRSRVGAVQERVLLQEDAIRATFAENLGLELTTAAIVAAVLDPDVNTAIVNRQISVAEVGGEAALSGFVLNRSRATSLVQAGFGREQARQLFQQASTLLGDLGRGGERQAERVDLETFVGSQALGDVKAQRRIQRTLAGEESDFSERGLFAAEDGAIRGLRQ